MDCSQGDGKEQKKKKKKKKKKKNAMKYQAI